MPAIADVTVKKFDGTTDIVYAAISGSGGDSQPAVWRQDAGVTASLPLGHRKTAMLSTKYNGPRSARQAELTYIAPYAVQDSTTTKWSSTDRVQVKVFATVPLNIPASEVNEAVYQACNIAAATLIKSSMASGYAPT